MSIDVLIIWQQFCIQLYRKLLITSFYPVNAWESIQHIWNIRMDTFIANFVKSNNFSKSYKNEKLLLHNWSTLVEKLISIGSICLPQLVKNILFWIWISLNAYPSKSQMPLSFILYNVSSPSFLQKTISNSFLFCCLLQRPN